MLVVNGGVVVTEADVTPEYHRPGSEEYLLAQSREWLWARGRSRRPLKNEENGEGE